MIPSKNDLADKRVLVVGDVMLDRYWFGSVDRISPEAPVPVVRISTEQDRVGGAANVALNIKMLGAQPTLMTMLGNDSAARTLERLLREHGVDTVLGQDDKMQTIVKLRVIGRSQQLIRIDFESEPAHEVLAQMLSEFERVLPSQDAVLFSDYGKGGLAHIPSMIKMARQQGKPVLVDPKGADYARYAGATVITPNRAELAQVVGSWASEAQLADKVLTLRRQMAFEQLLLTRSEEGMSLFDDAGVQHVSAQAREVYDVTGAGDTVIATMAVLLATAMPAGEAMQHANRAGGIVVGKFGTATLTYDELFA